MKTFGYARRLCQPRYARWLRTRFVKRHDLDEADIIPVDERECDETGSLGEVLIAQRHDVRFDARDSPPLISGAEISCTLRICLVLGKEPLPGFMTTNLPYQLIPIKAMVEPKRPRKFLGSVVYEALTLDHLHAGALCFAHRGPVCKGGQCPPRSCAC